MTVTVYQLAAYRLTGVEDENSPDYPTKLDGRDFDRANLPMIGGCQICGATVAAYNSCPSRTGYLRCLNGCIGDEGYKTVREAHQAVFGTVLPLEYRTKV